MKKAIGINANPRKNWNTAQAVEQALEGAASAGAETRLVHLYELDFKGCVSCFAMPDGKYYTGIMALPLFEGALDDTQGQVHFSAALYPDESGLDAYDATFPEKEKRILPCQDEFAKASTEIDTRVSF